MNEKPDGGPAFPCRWRERVDRDEFENVVMEGMSLRDWFAGQALVGLLLNMTRSHDEDDPIVLNKEADGNYWRSPVELAYRLADAMLAERGVAR